MTDTELAALDSVVVYYMSQGWPSYSDRERADKVWTDEKSVAQSAAFKRHLAQTSSGALLTGAASAGPDGCDVAQKESARPRPDQCPVSSCAFGQSGFAGQLPCQQSWAGDLQARREYLRGCRLLSSGASGERQNG